MSYLEADVLEFETVFKGVLKDIGLLDHAV